MKQNIGKSWAAQLREMATAAEQTEAPTGLSDIFEEEPVDLTTFVRDSNYMNQEYALSPIQYSYARHFEQIYLPETYPQMVAEFGPHWMPVRYVNELVAEWGKGSGKDHTLQLCFARAAYLLLCLKNPQAYYGRPQQMIIHMLNVAAAASQAQGVFFKPLRSLIISSPWFADKFEGDIPGPQAQSIRFKKGIELISGHSAAETLEGKNLIVAVADEISAFPTEDEVQASKSGRTVSKTAEGIIDMLRSSATTRFPQSFKLSQISFPRYKGDAIQNAITEAQESVNADPEGSTFFASGPYKTWDVNPNYDRFKRIETPGSDGLVPDVPSIQSDYRRDPAYARAKYECAPELAENRYFQSDPMIFNSFSEVIPEPVHISYYYGEDKSGRTSEEQFNVHEREMPGWQCDFEISPAMKPMQGALYVLHGDMAIKGDRAGVAMSHVRTWVRKEWDSPEGEVVENRPVVKVDFVTSFEADAGHPDGPREIQLRWYRKLVYDLRNRGFNIVLVTFDGFQSADSMQILESRGIETDKVSTDKNNEAWQTLRDLMYDNRLEAYRQERVIKELRSLNHLKNGKVDHPPNGSKDEADALAASVLGAIIMGGDEGEVAVEVEEGLDMFGTSTISGSGGFDTSSDDWAVAGMGSMGIMVMSSGEW